MAQWLRRILFEAFNLIRVGSNRRAGIIFFLVNIFFGLTFFYFSYFLWVLITSVFVCDQFSSSFSHINIH